MGKVNNNILRERELCLQLKAKGLSRKEIAQNLGLTERTVKSRLSWDENGNLNRTEFGATGAYMQPEIDYFSFPLSKDESLFRHEIGDKRRREVAEYFNKKYNGKTAKVLYLADLHIPFTMYNEVLAILKLHADADIVVINGDLLDLFAVSKYAKDKQVALERELQEGREILEYIASRFKDVVITEGNHERRLKSFIRNIVPTDMQFLFADDVLDMVVKGTILDKPELENVHVVGSWWVKLFDTIFAHPDNYNNANLKTVQNTSEHFTLVKQIPHRACIIGHTHQAGWIVKGGVLMMETGCLCYEMDYHMGSKFTNSKWIKAYAVAQFDEAGAIIFGKSNVYMI